MLPFAPNIFVERSVLLRTVFVVVSPLPFEVVTKAVDSYRSAAVLAVVMRLAILGDVAGDERPVAKDPAAQPA